MVKPLFTALAIFSGILVSEALQAQSIRTFLVSAPLPVIPSERPGSGLSPAVRPAAPPVTIRILHDSSRRDFTNILLDWQIMANGVQRQKGTVTSLVAAPGRPALVRLPVRTLPGNEELYLRVRYSYKKSPLAEEQLLLRTWTGGDLPVRPAGDLTFTDDNDQFTIQSPVIRLLFNKQTGWLQHFEVKDRPLLLDTLRPSTDFWRTAHLQLFSTSTGSQLVIVRTEYTLPESACLLHLSYTINAIGEILVEPSIEPDSAQKGPPLPRFDLQWIMPPGMDSVAWYGPMTGPEQPAIYHTAVADRLSPGGQETSADHPRQTTENSGIRWWKITGAGGTGLLLTADSSLLRIGRPAAGDSSAAFNITYPRPADQPPAGNYRYAFKISPTPPPGLVTQPARKQ